MSVKFTALFIIFCLLLFSAGAARAQTAGIVTLRANSTSAQGSIVPVLTWSTNPVATSCRASGGWSGTKAASGAQTLVRINASTNYTLTCSWGSGSARVAWTAPTTNTDGSALTNLAAFRVYYSTTNGSFSQSTLVNDTTSRSAMINALAPGTWYFMVRALNSNQVASANSNVTSKAVSGSTAARTVGITITPATGTPKTIATTVYDVVRNSSGQWALGRVVGTIPIGRSCRTYNLTGNYYGVLTGMVTITVTPRTAILVAHCAIS
jgi:hypothetical protein